MRARQISLPALLLTIITLFGCDRKHGERESVSPPVKVKTEVIGESNSTSGWVRTYSGTVASSETTIVSFSVAGTISSLTAAEGQKVGKGQVLGKISSGDYENAANIAKAELTEARDAYNRLKKLHDADALPDIKWVEMEQKLKQAENATQLAERTLGDATLRSPVSGAINRKFASVGQNVVPGEPVYEIVSSGELTIDISVPENEIGNFSIGEPAQITFDNPEIGTLEGKVTQKSVAANELTRGFTVKVSLPANESKIMPGMLGTVSFTTTNGEEESSFTGGYQLPAQAVQLAEDNRNFVWIVKGGKAERRFVEADEFAAQGVIITKGLEPGDTVIVEGMRKVGTGTEVSIGE